jgi:hypothetical protein
MTENGSLSSTETLFCRLSIQAAADAFVSLLDPANHRPIPLEMRSDVLACSAV